MKEIMKMRQKLEDGVEVESHLNIHLNQAKCWLFFDRTFRLVVMDSDWNMKHVRQIQNWISEMRENFPVLIVYLVCGGKFENDNGFIMSPWYPNHYEDSKTCAYDIEAPLGKAIVLNFTDFDIENDCDFDSLTIYDGVNANSTLIGRYCGSRKPPVAVSTMNHMHLIFQTDSSTTGPGFKAFYSFVDARKSSFMILNLQWKTS